LVARGATSAIGASTCGTAAKIGATGSADGWIGTAARRCGQAR
jgi:hypothetical protein